MKSTQDNPLDPLGQLGAPIRQTPAKPADTQVAPGVYKDAEGRLKTNLPAPAPVRAPAVHVDGLDE